MVPVVTGTPRGVEQIVSLAPTLSMTGELHSLPQLPSCVNVAVVMYILLLLLLLLSVGELAVRSSAAAS